MGNQAVSFIDALKGFLEKKLYRLYKVTPTKVWMNDPREETDGRVEVLF